MDRKINVDAKTGRTVKTAEMDKDTTVSITTMNGLTKIFDLVRTGKHDEARKRIGKLSAPKKTELLVAITWIETALTVEPNTNAPNGEHRPINTRG